MVKLVYDDGDGPSSSKWLRTSASVMRGDRAVLEWLAEITQKNYLKPDSQHVKSYRSVDEPFDWTPFMNTEMQKMRNGESVTKLERGKDLGSLGGHVATGVGASTLPNARLTSFDERSELRWAEAQSNKAPTRQHRSEKTVGLTAPAVAGDAVESLAEMRAAFTSGLPLPLVPMRGTAATEARRKKMEKKDRNGRWGAHVANQGCRTACDGIGIRDEDQVQAINQHFFTDVVLRHGYLYSTATRRALVHEILDLAEAEDGLTRLDAIAEVQPLIGFLIRGSDDTTKLREYSRLRSERASERQACREIWPR